MELNGRHVLVAGFGRTGKAVCRFLENRGADILISESRPAAELGNDYDKWKSRGVRFETGGHTRSAFLSADLIVPSPGIPMIEEIRAAIDHGIPVISEVELAFRFIRGRIIGITGSNGKSTVTSLLHKILADAGKPARLAGNIGIPLIRFAEGGTEDDIHVTELSSFQLEHTRTFHPHIAILLNLTPDHLDWHGSLEGYYAAKRKILARQTNREFAVLNRDDPRVWTLREDGPYQVYGFSRRERPEPGCFLQDGDILFSDLGEERLMPAGEIPLPGGHNQENVMAAALAARLLGIPSPGIRSSIRLFPTLEHRLEEVRTVNGVTFFNDSKATNVESTLTAVNSFDRRLVLILGGRDKGADFTRLREAVRKHARCVLLMGEAGDAIGAALEDTVPLIRVASMREAVISGLRNAKRGEIVLLSPACTSFDMFESFEHRGREFKREVRNLAPREGGNHG